ncbi:hypothetical protein C3R44_21790, partial [Mycobacterium tuberculosis]
MAFRALLVLFSLPPFFPLALAAASRPALPPVGVSGARLLPSCVGVAALCVCCRSRLRLFRPP